MKAVRIKIVQLIFLPPFFCHLRCVTLDLMAEKWGQKNYPI